MMLSAGGSRESLGVGVLGLFMCEMHLIITILRSEGDMRSIYVYNFVERLGTMKTISYYLPFGQ